MKKSLSFILVLASSILCAQNFTWMRGSTQGGPSGVYGAPGVMSPTIDPGGRHGSGRWIDSNGDLWMFGGEGYSSSPSVTWLNDMWKYSVSQNQWTFMGGSTGANQLSVYGIQGVASASNQPGAREFPVCWTDNTGKFWMLGGFGFTANAAQPSAQRLGDLWRYDPATGLWTWMGGFNTSMQNGVYGTLGVPAASNRPGCRNGSATWVDAAGDLWLFGGRGLPASGVEGFLNDLWKYNIASGMWTWMGGTQLQGQAGVFGTQGVPSTSNLPGGKEFPASWLDALGKVYIFGGRGAGYFNDLWKYDPTAGTWTWLKGANTANQWSTYGTQGVPASSNVPGGRFCQAYWTDKFGQFWMFGGQGWATSSLNDLNDLWRYDVCTNNWIWMKGSTTVNQQGTYGTQLVPAATNIPGSRIYNNFWTDKNGRELWLIGGEGFDASIFSTDHMNDVWKYSALAPSDSIATLNSASICSGGVSILTSSGANSTTQWYNSATSTSSIAAGTTYTTPALVALNNDSTYMYYAQIACTSMPRSSIVVTVHPVPSLTVTFPATICQGASFTLQASGASNYLWNNTSTLSAISATANSSAYSATVAGTNTFGCITTSVISIQNILPPPNFSISLSNAQVCVGNTVQANIIGAPTGSVLWSNTQTANTTSITSNTATNYSLSAVFTDTNGCKGTQTTSIAFSACTGFSAISENKPEFSLIPNPSTGKFKLLASSGDLESVRVYNFEGRLLQEAQVNGLEQDFDLSLSPGIYYVEGKTAEGVVARKSFAISNQ